MGLQWGASLPPPLPSGSHSHNPKHKIHPQAGTAGPMRQVSETSEAEPGSMLPSHPLIHYPFSGEKKEKTFVHAYSECLGHCSKHALICKTSWNRAQFAEGQTKALRGQEFAQGHTHVSSRARVYTRGAHLCTPAAWARHTLSQH